MRATRVVNSSTFRELRAKAQSGMNNMAEMIELNALRQHLRDGTDLRKRFLIDQRKSTFADALQQHPDVLSKEGLGIVRDAAMMTYALHAESRVASMTGRGFYTIGPCGEELLAPIGYLAEVTDPVALHYRHLSVQLARRLKEGDSLEGILLARARGFCVSAADPVTGGAHCAIGGGPADYIVTSTLASQMCPAVGRALGGSLASHLQTPTPFAKNFVSFVSMGDGSINNGHYLSGENLANFATFRNSKVPLLTCITDNGIAISFKNHGYTQKVFTKKWQCKVVQADGLDVADVWLRSKEAFDYVRSARKPAVLLISNITRRFGHAATDRQNAYLRTDEIKKMATVCPVAALCHDLLQSGVFTHAELSDRLDEILVKTEEAFYAADGESKLTSREALVARNSAPLTALPLPMSVPPTSSFSTNVIPATTGITGAEAQVMRKHMTRVFDDTLTSTPNLVYIGEDVQHGGYYLITDGLHKKFPLRVQDFPPDETSLIGVAMGYSQAGLLPVVEIPYAKYLDCGMDMFTEACIMHWLSNGRQPNGMVIRLQGFGRGVFGGNYHTHNMLHMPPGLDVVCYSNGRDYARGMRYALQQAKSGRMAMFVDCTELLNMRAVDSGVSWEFAFTQPEEYTSYDQVSVYPGTPSTSASESSSIGEKKFLIVTYGSGVPLALQAQAELSQSTTEATVVDVVDCPLLSSVPQGLRDVLATNAYDAVLFADICKEGQQPLASHVTTLLNEGLLSSPQQVRCIAAVRTYNPLGTILTFLSKEDIVDAARKMRPSLAAPSSSQPSA